jgi:predicted nucleic acid binding AN1-type Zn finger protein
MITGVPSNEKEANGKFLNEDKYAISYYNQTVNLVTEYWCCEKHFKENIENNFFFKWKENNIIITMSTEEYRNILNLIYL